MKQKRIYPYLIDSNRIIGYYETLIEDGYKLKVFNRKDDKEVYDYFLPKIICFGLLIYLDQMIMII